MSLEITVRGPGGLSLTMHGERSWSIRDLKQRIEAEKGIAIHTQALSLGNQRLCDPDLLSDIDCPLQCRLSTSGNRLSTSGNKLSITMQRRNADQITWLKRLDGKEGLAKLPEAPDYIKSDIEMMLLAVGHDADSLKHAHQRLLERSDFILAAARRNPEALNWAPSSLWKNEDFCMAALQYSWRWLQYASDDLRSDRDFMMKATALNKWALQYASDELKADEDFVTQCMTAGRRQYIIEQMRDDGRSLCRAGELRQDAEVVTAAVKSKGTALEYASPELQADRAIVLQAVNSDPTALQYASVALQHDRNIVVAALEKDERAAEWVPKELLPNGYTSSRKRTESPAKIGTRKTSSKALARAGVKELPVASRAQRSSSRARPAAVGGC